MKNWMVIKNNVIDNIIKADYNFIAQSGFEAYEYFGLGDIGDGYVHGVGLFPKEITEQEILNSLPEISAYQFRVQLSKIGKRTEAENLVAQARQDIKDAYEYETSYKYSGSLVQFFVNGLNMSNEEIISFFNEAVKI